MIETRSKWNTNTSARKFSSFTHLHFKTKFSIFVRVIRFQISLYLKITEEKKTFTEFTIHRNNNNPIFYTVTSSENLLLSSRLMTIACVLAWPDLLLLLSRSLTSLFFSSCFVSVPISSVAGLPEVETATSLVLIGFFISTETRASLSLDEPWSTPLIPFFSTQASHFFSPFTSPPRHTFVHPYVMCVIRLKIFVNWREKHRVARLLLCERKICENLIGA